MLLESFISEQVKNKFQQHKTAHPTLSVCQVCLGVCGFVPAFT